DSAWRALVVAACRWPVAHALVMFTRHAIRSVQALHLERVSADALRRSVRPSSVDDLTSQQLRHAVRQARGSPGRFARILWELPIGEERSSSLALRAAEPHVVSVAEPRAIYSIAGETESCCLHVDAGQTSSATGDLAALQTRMRASLEAIAAGRHTAGVRALR